MKNIHVLPTDKPSSLYILGNNELKLRYTIDLPIDSDIAVNQHIYITSDEEIKVGDFVYSKRGFIGKFGEFENSYFDECKKIILTTDQSLIQDGVQAIDDEFLEWFVKNPSCEEVDINRDWGYPKIIIPKEEPTEEAKQRVENYMSLKGALEPKQETLEEASMNWDYLSFEAGAKWQQERMYSEEEVIQKILDFRFISNTDTTRDGVKKWFEQFKKK